MTKLKNVSRVLMISLGSVLLGACSSAPTGGEGATVAGPIDPHPATIEDARVTAATLEERLAANPNDPETLAAQRAFDARLDELNHLITRIEPRTGHIVSFFDTGNGSVGIQETHPKGEPSVVAGHDASSPSALYRALTGEESPAILAAEGPRLAATLPTELTPGPAPTADEAGGSRFHTEDSPAFQCFAGGDFHTCQTPWANGGSWNKNAKTSFFEIEPNGLLYVSFALSTGGGFFVTIPAGSTAHLWATSPEYNHLVSYLDGSTVVWTSVTDYEINNHNWALVNATGVTFNWSTEFRWGCFFLACNTP